MSGSVGGSHNGVAIAMRWSFELYSRSSVVEGTASAWRADASICDRPASSFSKELMRAATRPINDVLSARKRSRRRPTMLSISKALSCRDSSSMASNGGESDDLCAVDMLLRLLVPPPPSPPLLPSLWPPLPLPLRRPSLFACGLCGRDESASTAAAGPPAM